MTIGPMWDSVSTPTASPPAPYIIHGSAQENLQSFGVNSNCVLARKRISNNRKAMQRILKICLRDIGRYIHSSLEANQWQLIFTVRAKTQKPDVRSSQVHPIHSTTHE